jgi:hypothetical protein
MVSGSNVPLRLAPVRSRRGKLAKKNERKKQNKFTTTYTGSNELALVTTIVIIHPPWHSLNDNAAAKGFSPFSK